jgi:hypothetical protein
MSRDGTEGEQGPRKRSHLVFELLLASVIAAATAALMFYYLRKRLPASKALLLVGLFAFGTSMYSSASRALWQHGPAALIFMLALLTYDRLPSWKHTGGFLLGLLTGYSYTIRPSNGILIFVFAVLVWLSRRWLVVPYFAGAALPISILLMFHLSAFGSVMSPYYRLTQGLPSLQLPFWPLVGLLFAPSRGLFVFSPFLLFAALRFWPSRLKGSPLTALEYGLAVITIAYYIGAAKWPLWWGGGSFGPRLLCEVVPCLTVLLIPVVRDLSLDPGVDGRGRLLFALFVISGALSVGIHLRGACDERVHLWNGDPIGIDQAPERVWQWGDPQFLRGLVK